MTDWIIKVTRQLLEIYALVMCAIFWGWAVFLDDYLEEVQRRRKKPTTWVYADPLPSPILEFYNEDSHN